MKPNGKQFAVRGFGVVLLALCLLTILGNAETVHGTFKLPVQARWGSMLLPPGDYEFTADNRAGASVVTVRSMDSRHSGIVMSRVTSSVRASGSGLKLGESEGMKYVKALYLGSVDLQFDFGTPRTKIAKLVKPQSPTMASAAGSQ